MLAGRPRSRERALGGNPPRELVAGGGPQFLRWLLWERVEGEVLTAAALRWRYLQLLLSPRHHHTHVRDGYACAECLCVYGDDVTPLTLVVSCYGAPAMLYVDASKMKMVDGGELQAHAKHREENDEIPVFHSGSFKLHVSGAWTITCERVY